MNADFARAMTTLVPAPARRRWTGKRLANRKYSCSAFMLYLGWRTFSSRPTEVAEAADRPGLAGAFLSIFGLTMTNPMTIVSFAAIFAGLGVVGTGGADAAVLTLGVFCGSAAWWVLLTTTLGLLRGRVTVRGLTWVNRISGVVLIAFGIVAIVTGIAAAAG